MQKTSPTKGLSPVPSVGRTVYYSLGEADVLQINRRRTSGASIADRIKNNCSSLGELDTSAPIPPTWPLGAQAHIGNEVSVGDVFPLVIVRVWSEGYINGQVFLDGNDQLWVQSIPESAVPAAGKWSWPSRS